MTAMEQQGFKSRPSDSLVAAYANRCYKIVPSRLPWKDMDQETENLAQTLTLHSTGSALSRAVMQGKCAPHPG